MKISTEDIKIRLAQAIKQSKLSQTDIAKALGVSQQAISSYVTGQTMPALETLANLCKLLDEDTNYILCQED